MKKIFALLLIAAGMMFVSCNSCQTPAADEEQVATDTTVVVKDSLTLDTCIAVPFVTDSVEVVL